MLSSPHTVKFLLIWVFLAFLAACSGNKSRDADPVPAKDSLIQYRTTLLSDLPDSNRPKEFFLENFPKPVTVSLPTRANGAFRPPHTFVLRDNTTQVALPVDAQGRGFFTKYSTDNGLALDAVNYGYMDSRGMLWFGTNGGGVSRYDGKNFTNYTTANGLANNVVLCMTEDKKGNLWFGTSGKGVSKFDGSTFSNYTTEQGLANNEVTAILEDRNGMLWLGTTGGGLSKYNGSKFTNYTTEGGMANDTVNCIVEDAKGALWLGTSGGGLSEFSEGRFINYTVAQGLASNEVNCLVADRSGNIWIGTNKGISKYDGKNFMNYSTAQGLVNNVVRCIMPDRSGNLWMGTGDGGVSKFDGLGFTNYTKAQGLSNNAIRNIVEDLNGNIWISTFGGGISRFSGEAFINFTREQGLANNIVFSIHEDNKHNLWFGTSGGGVSKYDGSSITNYTTTQGLADNEVFSILEDSKQQMWFGTAKGGLSKFDGKTFTNYTSRQGLSNNMVISIHEDRSGNLWFGTFGGGVSKFNGKSFTNYTNAQGLAHNVVFSIFEDSQGTLWFGTLGGGVSRFDGNSFTNFTTEQGLADNQVFSITGDNTGNLWLGTQEGLSFMPADRIRSLKSKENRNNPAPAGLFETFTTREGLPDNFITQVLQGNDHKIYVGTNLGICELLPPEAGGGNGTKWLPGKIYNSFTGYPVKDVNAGQGAMFIDSKGIIWIGTGSDQTGLVRFNPRTMDTLAITTPAVVIEEIKINKERIVWNDLIADNNSKGKAINSTPANIMEEVSSFRRQFNQLERDSIRAKYQVLSFDSIAKWYPVPQGLVLPYKFNDVTIDFNCIETGSNFLVKYQYMLEGYDKDWSPPDHKTSASFGNINEGSHTFMLRALTPGGTWSKPVTYSFKVLPPWWRTWWMYLLYILGTGALLLFFFRWNNRRIIQQKKILEHKVTVATRQIREEKEKVEVQKLETEQALSVLKSTQGQLIQAEKMASLGELTAGVAHEIQNPLNFVNNFSELNTELIEELKMEKAKPAAERNIQLEEGLLNDIAQNLEKINHHGKRAEGIVKGMLQHSRSSSGVKEPADINALCDEYLRLTYHGLKAKDKSFNAIIKTDFDPTIGNINIIPQDIGRVILNLLTNAFYVVNEKKKLNISGYNPTVTISTKLLLPPLGGGAEIRITDNGNGIPQTVIDKIFQPFFTTKPTGQGTGLGLSLSYDIVTKGHGGELKVETKEGEGTTFIINLPA